MKCSLKLTITGMARGAGYLDYGYRTQDTRTSVDDKETFSIEANKLELVPKNA